MKLDRMDPTDEEVEMYRENHRLRMLRIQERFMAREEEEGGGGSAKASAENNHVKDYKEEEEEVLKAHLKPETISLFQKVNKGPSFAAEISFDDDLVLEDLNDEEDLKGGNAPQPTRRQMLLVRKTASDKAQEISLINKLISGLTSDSSNNNIH
jgi:hypothetical protein